jgi:hypothetical protein
MNAASMLLCLFSFTGSPSDVSLKIKNQISLNDKQEQQTKKDNNSVADPNFFYHGFGSGIRIKFK